MNNDFKQKINHVKNGIERKISPRIKEIESILNSFQLSPPFPRNAVSWEIQCWVNYAKQNPDIDIKTKFENLEDRINIQRNFLNSKGIIFDGDTALIIIDDHKIYFPGNDFLLPELFTQVNLYEENTVNLLKKLLKNGMNVINIGANVGYFTLFAAREVGSSGKVIAFEPKEENVKFLRKNVEENKYTNVNVIHKAVTNKNEETKLLVGPSSAWNFIIQKDMKNFPQESVTTTTIDEFLKDHPMKIDFVLMDAEGSEPYILEGMNETVTQNPNLQIITEYNPHALKELGKNGEYFLQHIEKLGFSIFLIDESTGKLTLKNIDEILNKFPIGTFTNLYLTRDISSI